MLGLWLGVRLKLAFRLKVNIGFKLRFGFRVRDTNYGLRYNEFYVIADLDEL